MQFFVYLSPLKLTRKFEWITYIGNTSCMGSLCEKTTYLILICSHFLWFHLQMIFCSVFVFDCFRFSFFYLFTSKRSFISNVICARNFDIKGKTVQNIASGRKMLHRKALVKIVDHYY